VPDLGDLSRILVALQLVRQGGLWFVGLALDLARKAPPWLCGTIVIVTFGAICMNAVGLQRHTRKALLRKPRQPVSWWRTELRYSLLGVPRAVVLPIELASKAVGWIAKQAKSKDAAKPGEDKEAEADAKAPVLVATIGPSYVIAAISVGLLAALGAVAEPILRGQLGLSSGYPAWQYLWLGSHLELAEYIPLQRYPYPAVVVVTAFWIFVWVTLARIVRIAYRASLFANVHDARETAAPLWRTWLGASALWCPDSSFIQWARWVPVATAPLLMLAWGAVGAEPYRIGPTMFAVAVIGWTAWTLHLVLRGAERPGDSSEKEKAPEAVAAPKPGWPEVIRYLVEHHAASDPGDHVAWRLIHGFEPARTALPRGLTLDLVDDLLPRDPSTQAPLPPTEMQARVLGLLFTDLDPGAQAIDAKPGQLTLERGPASLEESTSAAKRTGCLVLAPEHAGKTTLALLAGFTQALVRGGSTLYVLRDHAQALEFAARWRASVEGTTLRWNLRMRVLGGDLADDLAEGIIPDAVVCGLEGFVCELLGNSLVYDALFRSLDLVVVDDIESFSGPCEAHAQLAFRRLWLRLRRSPLSSESGDGSAAPQLLALGCETMHGMESWVRALCGLDLPARRFDADDSAHDVVDLLAPADEPPPEGPHQILLSLSDLGPITVTDLIEACERTGARWSYRGAGDAARALGRSSVPLASEPDYWVRDPADAAVVIVDGRWSDVRRELLRLPRAGYRHVAGQVDKAAVTALLAVLPELDRTVFSGAHEPDIETVLRTLPHPILRAPVGATVMSHMSAELVDRAMEVEDVVAVFDVGVVPLLRVLAEHGLLSTNPYRDVSRRSNEYEDRVRIRIAARAIDDTAGDEDAQPAAESGKASDPADSRAPKLPSRVTRIDDAAAALIAVRDHTTLERVGWVDAQSAPYAYYPGRVIVTQRGRAIVASRASDTAVHEKGESGVGHGDVLLEPYLGQEVTSPRRRTRMSRTKAPPHGSGAPAPLLVARQHVLLGAVPFDMKIDWVELKTQHIATFRLDAITREVRQRTFYTADSPERHEFDLETCALFIYPEVSGSAARAPGKAKLKLGDARLICAALGMVLPIVYRSAPDAIDAFVHVEAPGADSSYELKENDAIVIFDVHRFGNGGTRAVHRDGVEFALRLAHAVLCAVGSPGKLLAQYDQWADEKELLGANEIGALAGPSLAAARAWLADRLPVVASSVVDPKQSGV
jgi:hypothetical protein